MGRHLQRSTRGPTGGAGTQSGYATQDSSDVDRARDAHRSAATLTVLVLLWGTISLFVVPWDPFWIPNVGQSVVSAGVLVYLARTWNRPSLRAAEVLFVLGVVYALLLLPWTTVVWCQLGRPLEAFTIPQGAILVIALVTPGRWGFTAGAMCLFIAECLFVMFYARHLGLASLLPITEPLGTFGYSILGFGLLLLRRRRRDLTSECVRMQAEVQAFDRIRPQFQRAREELDAQITRLAAEVQPTGVKRFDARSQVMRRALDRLADLRGKLGELVADDVGTSAREAERRLIERDAQLGAIVLASIAVALAAPVLIWSEIELGGATTPFYLVNFSVALAMLLYLVSTRHRPSSRRALVAMLLMLAAGLPSITFNQYVLLDLGRPYSPFMGHKLLMGILGLSLTTRFRLGVVLIVLTAANAIALWFILDLGSHRDIIAYAEPWATVIYMCIGLVSLVLLEQRQITSLKLMRARAEASAMHRRAVMFLALRDRLNSPLQTLVLGATAATMELPDSQGERVQAAVDRLVALSHELAELDGLVPPLAASIDPDYELRRQV